MKWKIVVNIKNIMMKKLFCCTKQLETYLIKKHRGKFCHVNFDCLVTLWNLLKSDKMNVHLSSSKLESLSYIEIIGQEAGTTWTDRQFIILLYKMLI